MRYSYKFKLDQKDMWKYYMIDRYSSLAGLVQIIFVVSLIILLCSKWDNLGIIMKILVFIGLSLFIVIQPLAFWINAKKAIDPKMPENEIKFDEEYMVIKVLDHIQRIPYKDIVRVVNKPALLVVQPDDSHIYILPQRVLGNDKKELFNYLKTKII